MKRPQGIPKWPYAFFKFYCKRSRFEEMHGDLEEYFYQRVERLGMVKARWLYLRDVLRCCQPYAWKTPHIYKNSNIMMFNNYFKTASRSALRNPLSTFINIFGLAMAIGVCVMTYSFMNQSLNTDKFHENKDKVFLATIFADRDGKTNQYGLTPLPLAEHLKEDFANIERVCRIDDHNTVIRLNDQVFYEDIRLV
ncbi:MAG: ABC transporter permease, partial [Cytophagia bacterium]|nr:ABC transporter permease [Cytophagia bacterium]